MGAAQGAWVKGKEEGLTAHKHQAYEVPHEFIYIWPIIFLLISFLVFMSTSSGLLYIGAKNANE